MEHFCDGFFDEEENIEIVFEYKISSKGYCYTRTHRGDYVTRWKRIVEKAFVAAYESYKNY